MTANGMTMAPRRLFLGFAALLVVALVAGCAHPVSLAGDVTSLAGTGSGKIDKAAGLNISDDDRKREVTSPGGGGDKVSYLPYRDLETGLYVALSETFSKVALVKGPNDPKAKAEGLNYVFTTNITTTSYSPSMLTWPPTVFTVEISGKFSDPDGKTVTELRAVGDGRAEYDEFKTDFSLAAKRAAMDALKKLIKALDDAKARLR